MHECQTCTSQCVFIFMCGVCLSLCVCLCVCAKTTPASVTYTCNMHHAILTLSTCDIHSIGLSPQSPESHNNIFYSDNQLMLYIECSNDSHTICLFKCVEGCYILIIQLTRIHHIDDIKMLASSGEIGCSRRLTRNDENNHVISNASSLSFECW